VNDGTLSVLRLMDEQYDFFQADGGLWIFFFMHFDELAGGLFNIHFAHRLSGVMQ